MPTSRSRPVRSAAPSATWAIERSTGDWVLWIDADMVLTPRVVEDAVAAAEHGALTAVFIPEVTVGDGLLDGVPVARAALLRRRGDDRGAPAGPPRLLHRQPRVRGRRRRPGGRRPARMRLISQGEPMGHIDTYILHDEGRLTLADIMRKRYYYGQSLPAYNRCSARCDPSRAGPPSAMMRGVPVLGSPLHAAALAGLRAAEATAYAAGAGRAGREVARRARGGGPAAGARLLAAGGAVACSSSSSCSARRSAGCGPRVRPRLVTRPAAHPVHPGHQHPRTACGPQRRGGGGAGVAARGRPGPGPRPAGGRWCWPGSGPHGSRDTSPPDSAPRPAPSPRSLPSGTRSSSSGSSSASGPCCSATRRCRT